MKTKLVPMGDARGVQIPESLLQQAGLRDAVEIEVLGGGILIRAGGGLPDEPAEGRFGDVEWGCWGA